MIRIPTGTALPTPLETPLVRMGRVWVKPELWQWTGSVKYRMVHAKIEAALREGVLVPGMTLIEATSGSTGAALAHAGEVLGFPVELHAYPSIAPGKKVRIEERGASLLLHPAETPFLRILDLVRHKASIGAYWHLDQYDRRSTLAAYGGLCQELIGQLRAQGLQPEVLACPVGTGGMIQALGCALREQHPGIRVVAIEPEAGSAIEGTRNTETFHLGARDPYDRSFPDEVIRVVPPKARVALGSLVLGESASAACAAAADRPWGSTVIVAAD